MEKVFDFLSDLKHNNNRNWFNENKDSYEIARSEANQLFERIYDEISEIDKVEPLKKYRIYRDIRFSLDKTPYKNHFSAFIGRKKPYNRGGFYIHLEPNNCFIGGGFWGPEAKDLLRIRQAIDVSDDLKVILSDKNLINTFGNLVGEELKTAPKGFPKDHERIELLRKKQFLFIKNIKNDLIFDEDFPLSVKEDFETLLPFFGYMTEVLTIDDNGEFIF